MWYCICIEVMKMRPLKQKVSITLDEDIVARVEILSQEASRSFSQYINWVLKEHLNKLDSKKDNE